MRNGKIEYSDGDVMWYVDDKLHRTDGPAIERVNGTKKWFVNDELHREDGPAVECYDGTKEWYLNGTYHREDGPAVIWSDGSKEWYWYGRLVYSYKRNYLKEYPNLSESFKRSVIKYELRRN